MRLIDIQCARCGAMLRVNADLPGCMCQYCGNQIILNWNPPVQMPSSGKPEQFDPAQFNSSQPPAQQDDMHKVEHYKKALKMNTIICLIAFVARFIFTTNIVIAFVIAILLFALCLKDAIEVMKNKKLLERNGVQSGNIVGLLVLVIVDLVLWCWLLVSLFSILTRG